MRKTNRMLWLGAACALCACDSTSASDNTAGGVDAAVSAGGAGGAGQAGGEVAGGAGGEVALPDAALPDALLPDAALPDAAPAGDQPVEIAFEARVGGEAFSCKQPFSGLGTTGATARFLDFRLYVHDFRLMTGEVETPLALDQDGVWQQENLALLDFEDKSGTCGNGTEDTNARVHGVAPAGVYDGLRFKVGVPFALNHADVTAAQSPLNLSGLFWNWQGGYKFMRVDTEVENRNGPFNFHLGSTLCDGDPTTGGVTQCDYPNVIEVSLTGFDPREQAIVVDYAALVAGVDLSTDSGMAPGCMSSPRDAECVSTFAALGLDIESGAQDPAAQHVFSVAP